MWQRWRPTAKSPSSACAQIQELEGIVLSNATEDKLQDLITRAPWLVEPTWTVLTKNQGSNAFKAEFQDFYEQRTGEKVILAIGLEKKEARLHSCKPRP